MATTHRVTPSHILYGAIAKLPSPKTRSLVENWATLVRERGGRGVFSKEDGSAMRTTWRRAYREFPGGLGGGVMFSYKRGYVENARGSRPLPCRVPRFCEVYLLDAAMLQTPTDRNPALCPGFSGAGARSYYQSSLAGARGSDCRLRRCVSVSHEPPLASTVPGWSAGFVPIDNGPGVRPSPEFPNSTWWSRRWPVRAWPVPPVAGSSGRAHRSPVRRRSAVATRIRPSSSDCRRTTTGRWLRRCPSANRRG